MNKNKKENEEDSSNSEEKPKKKKKYRLKISKENIKKLVGKKEEEKKQSDNEEESISKEKQINKIKEVSKTEVIKSKEKKKDPEESPSLENDTKYKKKSTLQDKQNQSKYKSTKEKKYKKEIEEYDEDKEEEEEEEETKSKKHSYKRRSVKHKIKEKKYSEESDDDNDDEKRNKKKKKKEKDSYNKKKKKNERENSSEEEEEKEKEKGRKRHKKNKDESIDSESEEKSKEKRKRKTQKKPNKKKSQSISDSDSDSDSSSKQSPKYKSKKHKKKKFEELSSDSDSSQISEESEASKKHKKKKHKNKSHKTNKKHEHSNKKRNKEISDDSSNTDSESNQKNSQKKRYNRFSDSSISSDSSGSSQGSKKRYKSSMTYKEKEKQRKKEKKGNTEKNNKEIKKGLKKGKDEINESLSESNDESDNDSKNDKIIFENKERLEDNVKVFNKQIKEIKINYNQLTPKNQSRKFLMDEKNIDKENQASVQDIIDNFKNTDSVIQKYITEFKSDDKRKKFFKKQGFILTEKSMERLALLIHYILNGIPVLFEGNTGTSKTRTVLTACNYIKKFIHNKKDKNKRKLIRYNLSAETKIDDIIAKYVSDQNSFTGIKVQNGPYVEAYINGNIILFDEINLAPSNVLQCIQQSLDNGFLSVETNGRCLLKYNKNPNFALVATQNPNKGAFSGKRQELGEEFLSRFQKIYCPEIEKEEMLQIALGIARNVGYLASGETRNEAKKQIIKDIVNLHFDWAKETESQSDIQCFTIREIESVLECLSNNEDLYNTIMTIYGGRFKQNKKDELEKKMKNYVTLKNIKNSSNNLPKDFPKCFINEALIQTVQSVLLALKNKRNVIIVGNDETGLTQVAQWCSEYFNKLKKDEEIEESYVCFCTKNLECTDLIGTQKISDSSGDDNELIRFEPRFLYNAIIKGNCVVLDSINEAPSRVIERLNGLLDKKNSKKEEKFEVPENTAEPEIDIHEDFRIICTSNFEKINQISPAFVNRFEVIVLENQLKGLTEQKVRELIELLCNKYQREYYYNYKNRLKKVKTAKNKIKEKNSYPFGQKKMNENRDKIKIDKEIIIEEEMMEIILSKYSALSRGKNPSESLNESNLSNSFAERNDQGFDENSKKYLTMSSINKFCRAFIILKNKFRPFSGEGEGKLTQNRQGNKISIKLIIDFTFELLFEEHLSSQTKEIQKYLIEELIESYKQIPDLGEEQYYFDKSESLKKFMVQMYACSLVNQYLCIVGPPGIGKTIGARAFSFIREIIYGIKYEVPFYMHTFNQFTRSSDYYGISSLKDEKLIFREGTLTKSIKQGNVFIGDEFNISSEECMKAITPILELKFGEDILIPGIENKISINPDFFFIICQNSKNTFGRKDLPEKVKVKIKIINYPDRIKEEIENICESIYEKLFKGRENQKISKEEARLCGNFMMALNEKEVLTPWSLRDISKLFARINKQSQSLNQKHYENLNVPENILFYILSSTNDSLLSERLPAVVELISNTFKLSKTLTKNLSELYKSPPSLEKKENKIYIVKGKIKIFYHNYKKELYEKLNELPSLLDALFKILIASNDEPILISGPSSFKTFLAQLLFPNGKSEVISLNSESTISQLIGSSTLLNSEKAKNFYLMQIYEILQANNIENLLKDLEDFENNKEKIKSNRKIN